MAKVEAKKSDWDHFPRYWKLDIWAICHTANILIHSYIYGYNILNAVQTLLSREDARYKTNAAKNHF